MNLAIAIILGFYLLWCLSTGSIHVNSPREGTHRLYRADDRKAFWWFFLALCAMDATMFWVWQHYR